MIRVKISEEWLAEAKVWQEYVESLMPPAQPIFLSDDENRSLDRIQAKIEELWP